jgi:hypothetical protein
MINNIDLESDYCIFIQLFMYQLSFASVVFDEETAPKPEVLENFVYLLD